MSENYDETPILTATIPEVQPTAPPADENGFIVVPEHADSTVERTMEPSHDTFNKEDITKALNDISNSAETTFNRMASKVVAEADSSTSEPKTKPVTVPANKPEQKSTKTDDPECLLCPYYRLGNYFLITYANILIGVCVCEILEGFLEFSFKLLLLIRDQISFVICLLFGVQQ